MPSSCRRARASVMPGTLSAPCVTCDDAAAEPLSPISYAGVMVATRAASRAGSKPAPAALVAGIPAKARLHVVTGKGGTGKSTVAAALALALADGGRKVLLVEVESRQSIAQLFDMPPMPYSEERLTTLGNGGELFGLAIDPEQAMLEYLEMFYGLKRAGKGLKKMGAVDFVTTLAPGL